MEQEKCRTDAADFGGRKNRIRSPRNVRAAVVKRQRKQKRKDWLLPQTMAQRNQLCA